MSSLSPDVRDQAHADWIVAWHHDFNTGRWEFWIVHEQDRQYVSCSGIMPMKDIFEACRQTKSEMARKANTAEAVKKRLLS